MMNGDWMYTASNEQVYNAVKEGKLSLEDFSKWVSYVEDTMLEIGHMEQQIIYGEVKIA